MGYWKDRLIEADESGLDLLAAEGKYVCVKCIEDESLRRTVADAVESNGCTFCGTEAKDPIAAPLEILVEHINNGLLNHYEDPVDALPYESAEGGYQGTTWDTGDLADHIGLADYFNDDSGGLTEAVCEALGDRTWCELDPFALRQHESLSISWTRFCDFIKHQRRFFFLASNRKKDRTGDGLLDARSILRAIVDYCVRLDLVKTLSAGTRLYRVRNQDGPRQLRSALDLGAPPRERATQSNRMSPPGIPMTYLSEDALTALKETAPSRKHDGASHKYRIGEFELARNISVLDLTHIPPVPSIFDLERATERDAIIFLQSFAKDISRPIARDDRVHVEYVPTQVVTEYVRVSPALRAAGVEGIRYTSARRRGRASIVLFGGRELLDLTAQQCTVLTPEEERARSARGATLRLHRSYTRVFPKAE